MAKSELAEGDNTEVKSPSRLKKYTSRTSAILAIFSLAVMFAGIYSLKVVDLREQLFPIGPYALYLFVIFAIIAEILGKSEVYKPQSDGIDTNIDMNKVNEQLLKLETRFGAKFFAEYEALKTANSKMLEDIEAVQRKHQDEQDNELHELRQRNAELEALVKQMGLTESENLDEDIDVVAMPQAAYA